MDEIKIRLRERFLAFQLEQLKANLIPHIDLVLTLINNLDQTIATTQQQWDEAGENNKKRAEMLRNKSDAHRNLVSAYTASCAGKLDLDQRLPGYREALAELVTEFPASFEILQTRDRFFPVAGDPAGIRMRKWGKRFNRNLNNIPRRLGNVFRKVKKAATPATQEIPVRAMAEMWGAGQLAAVLLGEWQAIEIVIQQKLIETRDTLNHNSSLLLSGVKGEQAQIQLQRLDSIISELTSLRANCEDHIRAGFAKSMESFEQLLLKGGTLEFPRKRVIPAAKEKAIQTQTIPALRAVNLWSASIARLCAWWSSQLELEYSAWFSVESSFKLRGAVRAKYDLRLAPLLDQANTRLRDMITGLGATEKNKKALIEAFGKFRVETKTQLASVDLVKISEAILAQNFPILIEKPIQEIVDNLPNPAQKISVVKNLKADDAILPSGMEQVDLRAVIEFGLLKKMPTVIADAKNSLLTAITDFRAGILEVGQMVDFNLETGETVLEKENGNPDTAFEVADQGLDRAAERLEGLQAELERVIESCLEQVSSGFENLAVGLRQFEESKPLLETRNKMLRSIAIEKGKVARRKVLDYVRRGGPMLLAWVQGKLNLVREEAQALSARLGLVKASGIITSQISDFLAESDKATGRLPHVYQRLFRSEPVHDDLLYVAREASKQIANKAVTNWNEGRYTPTAVVGETGAGKTSFIERFLLHIGQQQTVLRISTDKRVWTESDLIDHLVHAFEIEPVKRVEDLITAINAFEKSRFVVMEDMEGYFLKTIGGFDALKSLFQIVSETNRKVFWLFSLSPITWNFLKKAIQIDDYMGYVIPLDDFGPDKIEEIIMKRHRLSGYSLVFTPSKEDLKSPAFRRIPEEDRQAYLRKIYFKDLNAFAGNNLSIAFLFWMRSALEVGQKEIRLGSLKDIDLSFMGELGPAKTIMLHQLLLHNGMTTIDFATASRVTETTALRNLLILLDDGIVVRKEQVFRINPLLTRNSIRLLNSKNFIH